MSKHDLSVFVMGSFDGLTCGAGTIAASYLAGNVHVLILVALGLALAEAVAMAGGQYLSEISSGVSTLKHAGIIGLSACLGVLLPALPFLLFVVPIALVACILMTVGMAMLIAQVRASSVGVARSYLQTFAILCAAGGLSVGITLLVGK